MSNYLANSRVAVYPFTRQIEGEEIIIGRPDRSVFLVLPADAVELLNDLADGNTVGQAQSLYVEKYREVPDLQELLDYLERQGFVRPLEDGLFVPSSTNPTSARSHFENFPQSLARRLFSRSVLVGCGVLIALALASVVINPSIIPGWKAQFFQQNTTLMLLALTALDWVTLSLHEMTHLIAARAVGVSARMGLSHRLWILVAETDITGVWSVPRHQRYLPFLAGPLLDAVSASVLILVLFSESYGWVMIHPIMFQLGRALLFTYLLRLVWQSFFFLKTDLYYVFSTYFGCRNLMSDTKVFLRNQTKWFMRSKRMVDQSHIPAVEMRVIRYYALLWVVGRFAALCSLVFVSLPLMWNYFLVFCKALLSSVLYKANPYAFFDALILGLLFFGPQVAGLWLWMRSIQRLLRR